MLPSVAQPFTEAIVGAGLGALLSKFVLRGEISTGAIIGGVAGYGIALTKAKGAFPFTAVAGEYVGDDVIEQLAAPTQPLDAYGQPVVEEIVSPDWHRPRRDDWWRRGGGGYGRGGWGHGWRR
jgi:hypothetical protein